MPTRQDLTHVRRVAILAALLGATLQVSPVATGVPAADAVPAAEVVYQLRKTVSLDGRVREEEPINRLAELSVDVETLRDDQGRQYQMEADASQKEEGGDVTYELRLLRTAPHKQTEQEIEAAWKSAHPGAPAAALDGFRSRRLANQTPSPPRVRVTADLLAWARTATGAARRHVIVRLRDAPQPLDLPKVDRSSSNGDSAALAAQMQARADAIEARKLQLAPLQEPVMAIVRSGGGHVARSYWLVNAFEAHIGPALLERLLRDERIERIETFAAGRPDQNNLDDMRGAAQTVQLHDGGFTGERASSRNPVGDIYLAIIDTDIDMSHPAWNDAAAGPSRLTEVWRWNGAAWNTVAVSAVAAPSHGTKVAGVAVGDLMDAQDPAYVAWADREDRTGFAPEASFVFIEESGAGATAAIEQAVALSVDVINLSMSFGANLCDLGAVSNDAVDEAMLDGVFFAKSASNNGTLGATCNVGNPGTASGSFTVNAIDRAASPLQGGSVPSGTSSRGGDAIGRSVVAIAAYTGPAGSTAAEVGSTYGVFGATSGAAPVVAGSAVVLKDHLLSMFSYALVNEVGYQYATMLLMGDGQLENGSIAGAQDGIDELYGVGRLRMRMFNADGMDYPWRFRLIGRTISDGELASDLNTNPDAANVNQPIPADVERMRTAIYWHEPNVEDASGQAEILFYICNELGNCYGSPTEADQHQRILLGNVVANHTWTIHLNGLTVPDSLDTNYHYLRDERKVFTAVYWEDTDRDDANNLPPADIQ
jgi:hypothetical protein